MGGDGGVPERREAGKWVVEGGGANSREQTKRCEGELSREANGPVSSVCL